MGMYTEEGILTAWLRPAGTRVAAGEPVAEITTDKATFEIPAPEAGILHPVISIGTSLRVEMLMGYILAEGEDAPGQSIEQAVPSQMSPVDSRSSKPLPLASPSVEGPLRASPAARRLAAQQGVDLQKMKGSGPGGRIVEADVLAAVSLGEHKTDSTASELVSAGPPIAKRLPLIGHRKAMAEGLRRSLNTAASTTVTREASADILVAARKRLAQKLDHDVPFDALFIKLLAAALNEHPELNATLENDSILQFAEVNVGFAVAAPHGLLVPVVRDAASMPFGEVVRAVAELSARAATGKLHPSDLTGGTATISNLGVYGIDAFTPILNGSQSVILGIGRIAPRPAVREGNLTIGNSCVLSLTFDHRVADGVPAAQLLDAVVRRMNDEGFFAGLF
jgi:pyruvate dehydrogenase E2 component (dihydrolipoyllysine-residue acetyltransferase)